MTFIKKVICQKNFCISPNNSVLKCRRDNENLPSFIRAFKTLVLILLHIEIRCALNETRLNSILCDSNTVGLYIIYFLNISLLKCTLMVFVPPVVHVAKTYKNP